MRILNLPISNNNRNHQNYSQGDAGLHLSEARKNNAIYIGSKFKPGFTEIKRKYFALTCLPVYLALQIIINPVRIFESVT